MSSLGDVSYQCMVAATVMYLIAMIAHAVEWASLRDVPATVDPSDSKQEAALTRSRTWGRTGVFITILAVVLHTVAVVTRGIAAQRPPWGNMYEFMTTALLAIALTYLLFLRRYRAEWLGLIVTGLLTLGMGLSVTSFYVPVSGLMPALDSVWFVIHIAAATLAAAGFNIAAVVTILYLIRLRAEKKGPITKGYLAHIPDSKSLDTIAYRLNAFSFPVWTFAVAAGAVWAQYAWGRFWGWDPKETWALVTWVIYAAYLHARATAGWRGPRAAYISLIGVASFWFNFIGVNLLFDGLHSYSGI